MHRPGSVDRRLWLVIGALALLAAACASTGGAYEPETATIAGSASDSPPTIVDGRPAPPPDFRVAFLGDQGTGRNPRAVLELVQQEGAQMLVLLGDFDYQDNPDGWDGLLNEVLGPGFPVFAVVGNHDNGRWADYRQKLDDRLARIVGASCNGDYGVNAACRYRGLFFILSGVGTRGSGHAAFIRDELAKDDSIWSICVWHKDQNAMQVGDQRDETGWDVYEECRTGGAIIATAHEHSYQRTKTLSGTRSQTVDPGYPEAGQLRVGGGSTFVFVAGLGGKSIRDQKRCRPTSPPYGCNREWASIYTSDQKADYGALFIDFNVDGDPRKARGYFKNIKGQTVDSFDVVTEDP